MLKMKNNNGNNKRENLSMMLTSLIRGNLTLNRFVCFEIAFDIFFFFEITAACFLRTTLPWKYPRDIHVLGMFESYAFTVFSSSSIVIFVPDEFLRATIGDNLSSPKLFESYNVK